MDGKTAERSVYVGRRGPRAQIPQPSLTVAEKLTGTNPAKARIVIFFEGELSRRYGGGALASILPGILL